jgi:hypothetical protein
MTYPNLSSSGLPERAVSTIRAIYDLIAKVQGRVESVEQAGYVTRGEAAAQFGAPTQKATLQAGGSTPLDVTGLTGVLAQPQVSYAPSVTSLPSYADPLSQNGTLVSLNGVIYRFDGESDPGTWVVLGAAAVLTEDTHANRSVFSAADYPIGMIFYETDRKALYHIQSVGGSHAWVYLAGMMSNTLANIPTDLGSNDVGFLLDVSDYAHILRWDGAAWGWGPGETGSGYVQSFAVDPTGSGWQLCNGTTVAYLKADGTTATYATPDLVSSAADAAYLKFGASVSGPNAAAAPSLSGSIGAAATGITASTSATGTTTTIQNGAGVNVTLPSQAHVHAVNVSDPTHSHSFTGGAIGDDGEPRNMVLRPWFRR